MKSRRKSLLQELSDDAQVKGKFFVLKAFERKNFLFCFRDILSNHR